MDCTRCGKENRTDATFCDGCGARLNLLCLDQPGELHVGREQELTTLNEAIKESSAGHGRIVVISGEPGIGKTRTAEIAAGLAAEQGYQVLWGRCHEGEGAPPYWPWVQMLRGWLGNANDEQLKEHTAGGANEIASLAGELRERLTDLPPADPAANDDVARFRLFEAVSGLWCRYSRANPLLLIIDDLHWADKPSLKLLEFFSHEVASNAILLLATYRDIELSREHPLSDTLGDLSRRSGFLRLQLAGLNLIEASQLIAMTSGKTLSTTLVTNLFDRTEGNPLFLAEMARYFQQSSVVAEKILAAWGEIVPGPLPEGIREVIGRRLNQLSPDCNMVLSAAAAIGRQFDLLLLGNVLSEQTDTQLQTLLDEALDARVIEAEPEPGRFQFSHALIRETLYEELMASKRSALHGSIGLALEARYANRVEDALTSLAHHFSAALPGGDVDKALTYAELAGQRADSLLAFEEAARYYRLTLQTLEALPNPSMELRLNLYMRQGDSLINAGESFQALEAFRKAADAAQSLGSAKDFAQAAIGFEEASCCSGIPGHAAVGLLRSAHSVLQEKKSLLQAQVLAALARALIFTGDLEESRRVNADAEAMARELGDQTTLIFVLLSGLAARWGPERLPSRLAAAREGIDLEEKIRDRKRLIDLAGWYMFDLMEACDVPAAMHAFDLQNKLAHQLRQPYWLYVGTLFRATLELFRGSLEESERLTIHASEVDAHLTGQDVAGVFGLQMFNLRREQGRLDEVAPILGEFLKKAPKGSTWRPGLAILYAELDRKEEAKAEFEAIAQDDFAAVPRDALWPGCITYLAEVCVYLDDRERAAQIYEYLLPHEGYNIVVGAFSACHGAAARLLGMLATTLGRWEDAERHFESAISTNARQEAHPWLARSQYEFARMLLARNQPGDRERAQALMNESLTASREIGMCALEQRLTDQLRAIQPESRRQPHPSGLSPREIEILRLVATGKSNREIAETLFRSENTVANHIRNILAKTGSANRAEATAFAARNGLTDAS